MLAVGVAVDYSAAATTRSHMQNALDSAAFVALNLPDSATLADRQQTLDTVYAANGGTGKASIDGDILSNTLGASLKVNATYNMPMNFMGMVGQSSLDLSATSTVSKPIRLTTATFKLDGVTGAWDKVVTLMGRPNSTSDYRPLLKMTYVLSTLAGAGTTVLSVPDPKFANTGAADKKWLDIQKISCTALKSCTKTPNTGDGSAEVDMSGMEDVYMQMDITAKVGKVYWWFKTPVVYLRSNDPDTSDQMFVAGKQTPKGTEVNMIQAIGCNEKWVEHRWEDGGGWESAINQWEGTDFRYQVKGSCSTNGASVRLTN